MLVLLFLHQQTLDEAALTLRHLCDTDFSLHSTAVCALATTSTTLSVLCGAGGGLHSANGRVSAEYEILLGCLPRSEHGKGRKEVCSELILSHQTDEGSEEAIGLAVSLDRITAFSKCVSVVYRDSSS